MVFQYYLFEFIIEEEENEVEVFLLLSFSDLSHHRTCRSAYGGSLNCDAIGYKELSLTDNPPLQAYLL